MHSEQKLVQELEPPQAVSQSPKKPPTFFLKNIGPTLELLSFFSSQKVQTLLRRLSKKGVQFCAQQEQGIFRNCIPSVLRAKMEPLSPITNVRP